MLYVILNLSLAVLRLQDLWEVFDGKKRYSRMG